MRDISKGSSDVPSRIKYLRCFSYSGFQINNASLFWLSLFPCFTVPVFLQNHIPNKLHACRQALVSGPAFRGTQAIPWFLKAWLHSYCRSNIVWLLIISSNSPIIEYYGLIIYSLIYSLIIDYFTGKYTIIKKCMSQTDFSKKQCHTSSLVSKTRCHFFPQKVF